MFYLRSNKCKVEIYHQDCEFYEGLRYTSVCDPLDGVRAMVLFGRTAIRAADVIDSEWRRLRMPVNIELVDGDRSSFGYSYSSESRSMSWVRDTSEQE